MDGGWAELPPDAVETARESCDVAIRDGFELLKGDVLEAPEYGVLSFIPQVSVSTEAWDRRRPTSTDAGKWVSLSSG